jgi:FkbM family methyltransferase
LIAVRVGRKYMSKIRKYIKALYRSILPIKIRKKLNPLVLSILHRLKVSKNRGVYREIKRLKAEIPDIDVLEVTSYGQCGEDLVVLSIITSLSQQKNFFMSEVRYMEIGANHPIATSSTYLLYKSGAQGTLVEANPKLISDLKRIRPRDNVVNCAVVSDYIDKVELHVSSASELSSILSNFIVKGNFDYTIQEVIEVSAIEVNQLLAQEYRNAPCTFLSIDCEGLDYEILEKIQLHKYPFDIIQIEPSEHIIQGNSLRINTFLEQNGYLKIAKTQVNEIYVRASTIAPIQMHTYESRGKVINLPKDEYRTFDVFDTLITRRLIEPNSVILQLAKEFGFDPDIRIDADNGTRSFDEIYDVLNLPQGELIKKREIELELENLIPIQENLRKVQDGDILISDMYLPGYIILELCRRKGLTAQCSIYASNSDKDKAVVWEKLREFPPIYHLGDNLKSDVEAPRQLNINAQHYIDFKLREQEEDLSRFSTDLAFLIREIRLSSKSLNTNSGLEMLALNINLPMLISLAVKLNQIDRPLTFLGRDLQALYKVFASLTGRQDVSYLPFSRLGAAKRDLAIQYIETHSPKDSILVDLASTGLTHARLQSNRDFLALIYLDNFSYISAELSEEKRFKYLFKSSEIGGTNPFIEQVNCASHGALKEICAKDPIRLKFFELEVEMREIINIHNIIHDFENVVKFYPNLMDSIMDVDGLFMHCHSLMRDSAPTFVGFTSKFETFESIYMEQVRVSINEEF